MKLDEYNDNEKTAFVGLARLIMKLDRDFSTGEQQAFVEVAADMGGDSFWQIVRSTDTPTDPNELKAQAKLVERESVREEIWECLMRIGAEGGLGSNERELLNWLREAWELKVEEIES